MRPVVVVERILECMDLPADLFVRPVENADDIFAFQFPVYLEGKALDDGTHSAIVEELDDGDLIIEGWAAEFEGQDRQGENFTDGAFQRGIKSFLEGPASLCFHHKAEKLLGKVLNLEEVPGRGLRMRARIDGAIKTHPELGTIYQQIKKGTLTGLSIGGFFKRVKTAAGPRINDMDFAEISITPVPIHSKPAFSVVAGKALTYGEENVTPVDDEKIDDDALASLSTALDNLTTAFDSVEGKAVKSPKGSPEDLHALSKIIALEQHASELPDDQVTADGKPIHHPKVTALSEKVRESLKGHAKDAHALAGKLGPLPKPYID